MDEALERNRKAKAVVVVDKPKGTKKEVGLAHYNFDKLARMCGAGLNVALIGEAGTGKTYAAEQVASALSLKAYTMSFNKRMTSADLKGQMLNEYQPSPLYHAFKDGGVLILDEFDRSNTEVTVLLNNMLSGSSYLWPNGEQTPKHPDFRVVACQNTTGTGGSKAYAAASRQDGATLNRFVKLSWNTDEQLELEIAGDNEATRTVQALRANARKMGMTELIISPRQSIDANKLMSVGFTLKEAIHHTILEGLADDQIKRLTSGVEALS
jgi:MoxR-like ATPase